MMQTRATKLLSIESRPLILAALSVFLAETFIMFFLFDYLPTLPIHVTAHIDALLLTLIVAPILYTVL
ncbi:MAG: hypothetical protein ACE5D4_02650 [Thermodesulfobacteriota bacterium]